MTIEEAYIQRKDDPIWNTSYPLSPKQWASNRVAGALPFGNESEMSFYIHIPFCRQICSFCEYTRTVCPDEKQQYQYLRTLDKDVSTFVSEHYGIRLRGFDIGGGTPTSLSEANFHYILQIFREALDWLDVTEDFEPSIEGTFDTLSERKLESIVESGIHRLSLGIQSTDSDVLCRHHRHSNDVADMKRWIDDAHDKGISKVNIDMMYGLKGQNSDTIDADLEIISKLKPQQVTLYELRTNMLADKDVPAKALLFEQYRKYYSALTRMGYNARFGENAFSVDERDRGLSSYLRSRMFEGASYKGFGISAQSMSKLGISYNVGKGTQNIRGLLDSGTFEGGDTYLLPKEELASKYIAISAYNGSMSLRHLSDILRRDANMEFRDAIDFCINEGLATIDGDDLVITQKGFEHCGAVFSLFYSRPEI